MATGENMALETIRLDDENRDELQRLYEQKEIVRFDWENRWLKGEEYFYILANMEQYLKHMGIEKFGVKKHPESIYIEPINGLLYFVKGTSIGSEFGFPRLGIKKKYKWKKMNFTTDLPKKDPLVSYIVASAVKCEKFFPGSSKDGPCFRMHAVILKKRKSPVYPGCQVNPKCYSYILCHVRKVKYRKTGNDDEDAASNENLDQVSGVHPSNDNEEVKTAKTGNKRGRPRKNPLVVKDESSTGKSKRGRKPKKFYDIDQNGNRVEGNMTFNESENKDNASEHESSPDHDANKPHDSPLGPIEKNLKMMDSHNFSFDSMVNLGKNENNFATGHLPFYPRKQSLDNPFDKFFNEIPQNIEYCQEQRSRRVSSVLSPYMVPGNAPNLPSPSPIRGASFSNNVDFKANGFKMKPNNTHQSEEENATQKKLNELIAQSFKSWQNKPKRKETEEIDFSAQDNPILNILSKSSNNKNDKKSNPFDMPFSSILSPDYKPRSFSINSCGWAMHPHSQVPKNRQAGWDYDSNNGTKKEETRNGNEQRLIKVSTFTRKEDYKTPANSMRKSTMVDNLKTLKQASPLFFPKFSAAFKPFKKRANSFHDASEPGVKMNGNGLSPDIFRRRDEKASIKEEEDEYSYNN